MNARAGVNISYGWARVLTRNFWFLNFLQIMFGRVLSCWSPCCFTSLVHVSLSPPVYTIIFSSRDRWRLVQVYWYIFIFILKSCVTPEWLLPPIKGSFLMYFDLWLAGCLIGWSGRLAETTWTFSGCRGCEQNNGERERRKEVSRERQIKILYKHKVNPLSDHRPPRNNKLSAKSTTSVWNVN